MKLDISQTIVESCALDKEGNMHREGGRSMNVSRRWVSSTELGRYKTEKERKVSVGPGLRECEAGYQTNNYGELRVRWRGLLHSKGGTEHDRVKAQTGLGRYKTEREMGSQIREFKKAL